MKNKTNSINELIKTDRALEVASLLKKHPEGLNLLYLAKFTHCTIFEVQSLLTYWISKGSVSRQLVGNSSIYSLNYNFI